MSIVSLWGPRMPIWICINITPATFGQNFSVLNAKHWMEIYIKYKADGHSRLSLPIGFFFSPAEHWTRIFDTEGMSGGSGIGSKPCHLNDFVNISSVKLEPKCCSEPFFPYTTPFQPTKFRPLIRPPLVVNIPVPYLFSFISVDPSFLRQVA